MFFCFIFLLIESARLCEVKNIPSFLIVGITNFFIWSKYWIVILILDRIVNCILSTTIILLIIYLMFIDIFIYYFVYLSSLIIFIINGNINLIFIMLMTTNLILYLRFRWYFFRVIDNEIILIFRVYIVWTVGTLITNQFLF